MRKNIVIRQQIVYFKLLYKIIHLQGVFTGVPVFTASALEPTINSTIRLFADDSHLSPHPLQGRSGYPTRRPGFS